MALFLLYNAINLQLQGDLDRSGLAWFRVFFSFLFFPPMLCRKISINVTVLRKNNLLWKSSGSDTNDLCFELPKET